MKKIIEDMGMSCLYVLSGGGILVMLSYGIRMICSM